MAHPPPLCKTFIGIKIMIIFPTSLKGLLVALATIAHSHSSEFQVPHTQSVVHFIKKVPHVMIAVGKSAKHNLILLCAGNPLDVFCFHRQRTHVGPSVKTTSGGAPGFIDSIIRLIYRPPRAADALWGIVLCNVLFYNILSLGPH